MSFELIKIDDFKSTGRVASATIVFTKKGGIFLNAPAVEMLAIDKPTYLKILTKEDKLAVFIDSKPANGLLLQPEKSTAGGQRYKAMCIGLVKHLAEKLDWPIADGQLQRIKYVVGSEVDAEQHGLKNTKMYLLE